MFDWPSVSFVKRYRIKT